MNKKKLIILISIIIALAVLVCIGIFAISGKKSSKIADKLDLGEKYLEELDYEKALALYKEILEIDPKNVEAYLGIVDTYMAMGDYAMALEYAEKGYEETGDEVFVDKIEKSKEAGEQETQDPVSGETGNTEEEPPIATPEPDVLIEGTSGLEVVILEAVEVLNGNGGVLITRKNDLYGAMNYAGEEIVPNIYNDFFEVPNEVGYFALAHRTQVDEYRAECEVHVFNAMGQEEIVLSNVGTLNIHNDKLYFNTSQWSYEEELNLCSVQLYDMTNNKYLYSSGERKCFEGMSISISGEDTYYYTEESRSYQIQLNGTDNATAVEVQALSHLMGLTNFSEGYAWDIYTMYDQFTLVREDGQEKINCVELLWGNKTVSYYDNGVWKISKGKLLVMQDRETGKYHLMDLNYAQPVEMSMYANVDNVIVATYDYIGMSDSPYYLAANGDKYFYIDESGQIVHDSYLDYSKFYGGYAMIIDTDGCAYMIDEQFNKVAGGYKATSIFDLGGIFCVENNGELRYLTRPTE